MKPHSAFVFTGLSSVAVLTLFCLIIFPQAWDWLLPLHFAASLPLVYSCVRPNCAWFGPVYRRFCTNQKEVWLTIDDGFSSDDTSKIIQILKRFDAKASFFVIGQRVEKHGELLRTLVREGLTIENHSESHAVAWFWAFPSHMALREIQRGMEKISMATGCRPVCFRAPAGMANFFVHRAVHKMGQKLVGWSARGYDTSTKDADEIVRRIYKNIHPGTIVLLHEQCCLARVNASGISMLELLLTQLKNDGYRCIIPASIDLLE